MSNAAITKPSVPAIPGIESTWLRRRGDDRIRTTGQLIRVEHEQDEGLARCYNISDGGMAISAAIPLDLNDRVTVRICLAELRGRVVWMNGSNCGIAFDHPIDVADVLQNFAGDRASCARLNEAISVHRMNVTNDSNFRPGLKVRVTLDNGLEQDGIVHWSQDNIAGVMLLDPCDVIELGASRQRRGSA